MICAEPLNATRAQLSKQVNKAIWGSSYLSTPKFMDINKNALKRNTVVVYFLWTLSEGGRRGKHGNHGPGMFATTTQMWTWFSFRHLYLARFAQSFFWNKPDELIWSEVFENKKVFILNLHFRICCCCWAIYCASCQIGHFSHQRWSVVRIS